MQRENNLSLIDVRELERTIDERDAHSTNASLPIDVTEFGITKDVRLWHIAKA